MKTCLAIIVFAVAAAAQQPHKFVINGETDEGKALQFIGQESDPSKKQAAMEQFLLKYPSGDGAVWVYALLQPLYLQQNQFDKAIEIADKALAIDPAQVDIAYNALKAAEAKKDPGLVKAWSAKSSGIARKIVSSAKSEDEAEKSAAEHAKEVDVYAEYSLYAMALQTTDPAKAVDLVDTLEQRNPQSQYLPKLYGNYVNALRQSGQVDKAGATAEKLAEKDPNNEDVLLIAADYNLQKKTAADKVILYAGKLVEVMNTKPKPEGVSDADWQKKKESLLGIGNWMAGVTYGSQNKYGQADKALRAALPYLKDDQTRGIGLFYLGLSDYKMGQASKNRELIKQGLAYSEQSAALKSPVRDNAARNVKVIRTELGMK